MQPTIDIINLQREEIVWTDSSTFPGETLVGKIAAGLTPVTTRTGAEAWHIFRYNESTGEMTRPIDPTTGLYFDSKPQIWDSRAGYTYG